MDYLEKMTVGAFTYTRSEFSSKILDRTVTYGICRLVLQNEDSPRGTLYLLHGGNGDDRQTIDAGLLNQLSPQLIDELGKQGIQIALPWVGRSFLNGIYADYFKNELIPLLENGSSTDPQTRMIAGFSMGGLSALNLFFESSDLFSGVGAHFPTLITFDPADPKQFEEHAQKNSVLEPFLGVLKTDLEQWGNDPIALARKISVQSILDKKIYFDVGSKDDFGLAEGCRKLHEVLSERGISHVFKEIKDGKHDVAFLYQQFPKLIAALLGYPF